MIDYKCLLTLFIPCFFISSIISYIEIRKYYKSEAEMRRTNDMYIVHTSCLSTLGIINVIISLSSISSLIIISLHYFSIL